MSDYFWCHGPECHTKVTTDRVRGSKGSKVLRTRKIKQNAHGYPSGIWQYFCSNSCYNDFAYKYIQQVIRIAPRPTPLETPINDPKKVTHTSNYTYSDGTRHTWTTTEITKLDTESNVG